MVWQEPKDHYNDCYFFAVKSQAINRKNKNRLSYPILDSAGKPIIHSEELSVPVFSGLPKIEPSFSCDEGNVSTDSDIDFVDDEFDAPLSLCNFIPKKS